MTAHMIQPPDQVDDIIQKEYSMSQFPTRQTNGATPHVSLPSASSYETMWTSHFTRFLFSILLLAVIPALIFFRASRTFSAATKTPGKAKRSKVAVNYICMRMLVRDSHLYALPI